MKKLVIVLVMLVFTISLQAQQESNKSSSSHLGTWQLISFKYWENAEGFTEFPKDRRRIKLITDNHFTWTEFNAETKRIEIAAGGSCSMNGDTYIESIDFALSPDMENQIGRRYSFTIRIEDDKLFQSGFIEEGFKIEEVWQRMK